MLGLLTLNVSRPSRATAAGILDYLWHRPEPLLVLTETSPGEGSALIASVCRAAGHVVHSSLTDETGRSRRGPTGTALGVLVIARGVDVARAQDLRDLPMWPARVLALDLPGTEPARLIGVYGAASDPVRYTSATQRQRKRDWLLAFCTWLSSLDDRPTLMAGDLNIVAPGHRDRLPFVLAEERTAYDLITAGLGWRDLHAHTATRAQPTWVDHSGVGCRYDYVLDRAAHPMPGVTAIDDGPRTRGLSDHAALTWRPSGPIGRRPNEHGQDARD